MEHPHPFTALSCHVIMTCSAVALNLIFHHTSHSLEVSLVFCFDVQVFQNLVLPPSPNRASS